VGLIIAGEAPYLPSSLALLILIANLALFLGMIPVAVWLYNGFVARAADTGAGSARTAEIAGIVGALVAASTAILALPHWLPAVPAAIISATATGVIGIWLLVVNAQAFSTRLINRVLAALGVLAGVGWLLGAVVMWIELSIGSLGSLTSTLEGMRTLGGYLGEAFYLIWALWLGIWLLVRKR
jgi:hypothetical protein